ncbi:MAG: DUF3794 domain-containing protein, partial [Clostridia bacterium]|nr:DUF3794 domain-containing protein [Clostridia bacterium]
HAQTAVEFSDKAECEFVKSTSAVRISCAVIDCEVDGLTNSEISLGSVVEIGVAVDGETEISALTDAGGVYLEKGVVDYGKLCACGKAVGEFESEKFTVKMARILRYEHEISITDTSVGVDYIKINGAIYTRVVGQTDDGLITYDEFSTPFGDEITASGAVTGDIACVRAGVVASEIVEDIDAGKSIVLEYKITYDYCVYSRSSVEVVTDAFSPLCDLNIEKSDIEVCFHNKTVCLSERVDGNITLSSDAPIADNILCVSGVKLTVTNLIAYDDEVTAEGIVSGSVIYYSAENASENAVSVELPFSLSLRADGVKAGDEVFADGVVKDFSARLRRGNEIDIRAQILLTLNSCSRSKITVITAISEGEMRPAPTSAFGVHIARQGETLWDCCKALAVSPEILAEQNPSCNKKVFDGGEKIVIYRRKAE